MRMRRYKEVLIKGLMMGLMLVGLFGFSALAGEEWLTDFNQAKEEAAEKKLPILIDFTGSDWCSWCIKLDQEVFSQNEFKEYAKDHLVLFLADFPGKRGKKLAAEVKAQNEQLFKTYDIKGYPTILLLDASGKVIAQTGYRPGGAGAYVKHLKGLLK
ncbi:MAG: thioredoxin family protein [bacterium (Candidatus Ratteibacteria) CG_4_9_14_3_um_filter_41_21]|uniref:Thioredoxin family protein n=2 Tax=Candidatus Ratteibacteria TaxID=2979319 RepID=A0A2M7E8Z0_9BACT|nr:MAG: thioredoxin family protein [bacterium (Candidatus Ratteibacteria) CG01_land_8_20_14_3_00_40_19]PJA61929.1 MAG: thioredoxin family protein [bacterium (Candidatus Ratteibacteria) CG_4_9_14_3_um_filter_41_21]